MKTTTRPKPRKPRLGYYLVRISYLSALARFGLKDLKAHVSLAALGDLKKLVQGALQTLPSVLDEDVPPRLRPGITAGPPPDLPGDPPPPPDDGPPRIAGVHPAIERPDLILGTSGTARQWGLLGRAVPYQQPRNGPGSEPVYQDTDGAEFIVIVGDIGTGKTSTKDVIKENATTRIQGINHLTHPHCSIEVRIHDDDEDPLRSCRPTQDPAAIRELWRTSGARPQGLPTIHVVAGEPAPGQLVYPEVPTYPLLFDPGRLGAKGWARCLGFEEHHQTRYARVGQNILLGLRENVTVERLRQAVEGSRLPPHLRDLFNERLDLGARFLDPTPGRCFTQLLAPGRHIVLEVRDRWLKQSQREMLISLFLEVVVARAYEYGVPLLVTLDEGHVIMQCKMLCGQVEWLIKHRRHTGASLCYCDQGLEYMPYSTLGQASLVIVHQTASGEPLHHLQKAQTKWAAIKKQQVAGLIRGRALVSAAGGTFSPESAHFIEVPRYIDIRRRVSAHGGETRTATGDRE
jgi:hypothetical protein